MVEVSFMPEPADAVAVQRTVFASSLRQRRFWLRLGIALTLAFALCVGALALLGDPIIEAISIGLASVVAGLTALVVILGTHWLQLPRRARRWFVQQKTLHHAQRQVWDETGFRVNTERGSAAYPWDEFHGWRIDAGLVALHASEHMVYFAPRRALTDDQVAAIERLLIDSGLQRL